MQCNQTYDSPKIGRGSGVSVLGLVLKIIALLPVCVGPLFAQSDAVGSYYVTGVQSVAINAPVVLSQTAYQSGVTLDAPKTTATVTNAGVYQLQMHGRRQGSGNATISITRNGTAVPGGDCTITAGGRFSVATVQSLAAGDRLSVIVTGSPADIGDSSHPASTTSFSFVVNRFAASTGTTAVPRLINVSTRSFVGTGDKVMIAGFVIQDGGSKRYLIRALGPTLSQFGVTETLANPALEIKAAGGALIGANDDWQVAQANEIAATGFAPPSSLEPAIILSLGAGSYTAIVRGSAQQTGNAIVEVYELP